MRVSVIRMNFVSWFELSAYTENTLMETKTMTILIANIGTSDLAVKLSEEHGDFFIPIGFDRNEPNTKAAESELDDIELQMWHDRQKLVREQLQVKNFRSYTEGLLQEYEAKPELWHDLIRPGRILGVIEEAIKKSASDIYIFVTDQPEFIEGEKNHGYNSDTIHLFAILKLWIEREFQDHLNVQKIVIPQSISAIDQDGLFGEYYNFFQTLDTHETILISVKGGTPQMQTALRIQAITSGIANQIYLEPQLSIKKLLAGKASDCDQVSYWRYQRVQQYQTVKKLLERWDFDGANTILREWDKTLQQLQDKGIAEVAESRNLVKSSLAALQMAVGYFNLDNDYAEKHCNDLNKLKKLSDNYPYQQGEKRKHFPKLLNLYTQCCLLWETDRMADFLTRMGSFYEEVLHELIHALDGAEYFDRPRLQGDWFLQTKILVDENQPLAQRFYELEKQYESNLKRRLKDGVHLKEGRWIKALDDKNYKDKFKLPGRPSKLNFVLALVETKNNANDINTFKKLCTAMEKLDYWYVKRNKLIHVAKGISKQRMQAVLDADRNRFTQPILKDDWFDPQITKSIQDAADPPQNILLVMSE
ncbi:hypothetical protein, partial [Spirulina sp. 06S082]|uniref:hypothetical protein n=1 Tax=Spirulina sp. 06S082 TaxID=3110248 RepID=UPI002B1F4154